MNDLIHQEQQQEQDAKAKAAVSMMSHLFSCIIYLRHKQV